MFQIFMKKFGTYYWIYRKRIRTQLTSVCVGKVSRLEYSACL